ELNAPGEVLVARPALEPPVADLVDDNRRAVDRLIEPPRRRDAPPQARQPAIAVALHPLERFDVLSEQPQLAAGNAGGRGAKRFHERGGERRAPAENGDDRFHARAGFAKKSRMLSVT